VRDVRHAIRMASSCGLDHWRGEFEDIVRRLGRLARRLENGAAIFLQDFEPIADVIGMAVGTMPSEAQTKAVVISATSSSRA
jgi:hypothetical protein